MGVFGLLSHCLQAKKYGRGTEYDLFQVAKQRGSIEIVIDFRNFLYVAVEYSCKQLHQVDSTWASHDVGYLGGEYHIVKNLVLDFCKCMKKHNIVPVFFDDGAHGSDPEQYKNKLETWKLRNDSSVELSRLLADYLQNLGSIEPIRKSNQLPWLAKDQVKCALKTSLSNCGGKFIMCNGEADDMMVKYLTESDKAFAVLANDSDFLVMKNSRFIPEDRFDWDSIWLEDGDQCLVTVYTPEDVMESFGLTSHKELVDIAILAGNDFTKPLIHKIWGKDRTDLKEVIAWYSQNVCEGESLEDSSQFKDIVAKNPKLAQAVEYSRKFYNLEEVNRQENIDKNSAPLKKYLLKEVENFNLPSVVLAWYEGIHWGGCLLECHTMPSIDHWTKQLRCFLYTMCTEQKQFTVLSRSSYKMLDEQQILLKHYRWLPKVSEVRMLDDESRWKLFDRIVGYLESPVEHAVKEDIYNGLALHSFFQGYGTKAGFLIHAVNHLMTMAYIQKFHIDTWEYITLLATAMYCVARETDKIMFEPTWKKPSMRCITLGNWYQYIVKVLYQLSRILLISEHYPEPEETYQGSYFTALYMTILEKGVSQNYIDPGVLQTFNHILNENQVLDDLTKEMMKQGLSFIEYFDPNAVSDDSEDEEANMVLIDSHVAKKLPIEAHREKILDHINSYRVTCIEGETGSGKSTKVPQFIVQQYEQQRAVQSPRIIVTQPRRLAAKSLASRVANELGDRDVGKKVQYKRGQDHMFSDRTQIYYVTTSYMIELLVHNPRKFEWFTHIILDEIHERDLDADLMSLIVHLLMKSYTGPKIVIMSATLQAKLFVRYFTESPTVATSIQQHLKVGVKSNHKVQELYLEDLVETYSDTLSTDAQVKLVKLFCQLKSITISTLMSVKYKQQKSQQSSDMVKMRTVASKLILQGAICDKEIKEKPRERVMLSKYMEVNVPLIQALSKPGETILMFLPGRKDIDELYDLLAPYQSTDGSKHDNWKCAIVLYILHSSIPFEDQQQCFQTPNSKTCHVILATNIAESSLTLPKVTVIIDSGMRRHLTYDIKKRVRCLYTGWCSKASMQQRKGRTGRVCDGVCIRLMTREHFSKQPEFDEPQMRIAPLDKLLLQVKYVGRHIAPDKKPSELLLEETIEPPEIDNIDAAVKTLADIGALTAADECADMTLLGQIAMHLPLDLNLCRLIFYGCLFGCPCDAVVMAASLQAQDPFTLPSKKVMKDQEKFISSIRNSFQRRKSFDNNCYSEPIMCRNMYKAWLKKTAELINRDAEDTDFKSQASRNPKQDDIRKLREELCDNHALICKRLGVLEGFVADVTQNVLKCLPRLSENYRKLEELISIVPKRGKKPMRQTILVEGAIHEGIQRLYRLDDLFSNDILLLNTILTAALAPSFVFGSVQKEVDFKNRNKVPNSLTLERKMETAGIDPSKSICIPSPPKQFMKDDPLVEDMRQEIVRCISLIDAEASTPKKGKGAKSKKKRFNLHYTEEDLFIEYIIPRTSVHLNQTDPKNEITADLHDYVHYPYQFSEAPSGPLFFMELPTKQAIARNGGVSSLKVKMPQNPFRIEWSMMSADGIALKEKERPCKAICGWRNPIGFSCDVKKRLHFGVTSRFTKAKTNQVGWADGISLFPVYLDNLFSVVLMLTFMPKQHGVVFKVDTTRMTICEIEMFQYQIPVSSKYPLTPGLMQLINKIRSEVSDIFVNMEASIHRQIPDSNIRTVYQKLLTYMEEQENRCKKNRSKRLKDAEIRKGLLQSAMQKERSKSESSLFGANRFGSLIIDFEDDVDQEDHQSEGNSRSQSPCEHDSSDDPDSIEYNLPRFIKVNAFDLKAPVIIDKTEGNWRAPKKQVSDSASDMTDPPPIFQYLAPYDMHIFSKLCLSDVYGTQEELLHAEVESSDEECESEYASNDEDHDMDYIYTFPYQNPLVMKENLKTKVLAVLHERVTPIRLCDLIKIECVKDSIIQMNEHLVEGCFDLKQFIENSDADFVIADINSKNQVVCCQNEMGKTLAKIVESKDKAEEYIVSTVYCVLLERRNGPLDVSFLAQQLQKSINLMNQANEDTEILATLLNNQEEVFELVLFEDGKEKVKIRDDMFKKITEHLSEVVKEAGHDKTKAVLRLSTHQKVQVREILFDHLMSHQNSPISFDELANLAQVQQIIAKTRKNQKGFLLDNNRSVNIGEVFAKSAAWFEVIGSSVKLVHHVYQKNQKEQIIPVKEETVTTPGIWEEIECQDILSAGIWSIQPKQTTKQTEKSDTDIYMSTKSKPDDQLSTDKVLTYDRLSKFHDKIPDVTAASMNDAFKGNHDIHHGESVTSLSCDVSSYGAGTEDSTAKTKSLRKKEKNERRTALVDAVSQYCSERPVLMTKLIEKSDIKQLWEKVLADKQYNDIESFLSKHFKVIQNQKGEKRILDTKGMAQHNLIKTKESLKESMLNYCKKKNAVQICLDDVLSQPSVAMNWEKLNKFSPIDDTVQYIESMGDFCVMEDTDGCAWLLFETVNVPKSNHGQNTQSPYHDFRRYSPGGMTVHTSNSNKNNTDSLTIVIQNKIDSQGKAVLLEKIKTDEEIINEWLKSKEYDADAVADYIAKSEQFMFVEDTLHNIWVIDPKQNLNWHARIQFDKMFLQACLRKGSGWIRLNDVLIESGLIDQWTVVKIAFHQSSLSTYLENIPYFSVFHDQKNACWIKVDASVSKVKLKLEQQEKVIIPVGNANISTQSTQIIPVGNTNISTQSTQIIPVGNTNISTQSTQVKVKTGKQKDIKFEVQYVEKNFISAVEEYLLKLPSNMCLHATITLDPNVKATWNSLKELVQPKPMMRDVFSKYSDKFKVCLNEKNAPYVRLIKTKNPLKSEIRPSMGSSKPMPIQKAMSLSNLRMPIQTSDTGKQTKAELKLISKILEVFITIKLKKSYLKDIENPEVIEQWKMVKAEGTHDRFIEFINSNTSHFKTQKDETGRWIISIKQMPKQPKPENPSNNVEESLISEITAAFYALNACELSLKQLSLPRIAGKWNAVKAEGKYVKLIDFLSKRDGIFEAIKVDDDEWKIILLNPEQKDLNKAQRADGSSQLHQQPLSFKDALLSKVQVRAPLRKAESLMNLPTAETSHVPHTAAHREFVETVRSVFKKNNTNTLFLSDVQNPSAVQSIWRKIISQNRKVKFTDYLVNDTENFKTKLDRNNGWIVTLKQGRERQSSVPSTMSQISLPGPKTGAVPKTSSTVNPSPPKRPHKIDQEAEMMKGYVEGNFISAVKECLRNRPDNECLLCDLVVEHESVKGAWNCCEEQIKPSPSLKALVGKYAGAFVFYLNDKNEEVIQLNTGKKGRMMSRNTAVKTIEDSPCKPVQQEISSKDDVHNKIIATSKNPQIGTENRQLGQENVFSGLPDISAIASSWSSNFRDEKDDKSALASVTSDEDEELSDIDLHINETSFSGGRSSESESMFVGNTLLKDHEKVETERLIFPLVQSKTIASEDPVIQMAANNSSSQSETSTFNIQYQIPDIPSGSFSPNTRVVKDYSTTDSSSSCYSSPDRKIASSNYSNISPIRTDILCDNDKYQTAPEDISSEETLDLHTPSPSRSISSEAELKYNTSQNQMGLLPESITNEARMSTRGPQVDDPEAISIPAATNVHKLSSHATGYPILAHTVPTSAVPSHQYHPQVPLLMNTVPYSQVQSSLAYQQACNLGSMVPSQLQYGQNPRGQVQMMNQGYSSLGGLHPIPGQIPAHSVHSPQAKVTNQMVTPSTAAYMRSQGTSPLIGDNQINMSITGSRVHQAPTQMHHISPGSLSTPLVTPTMSTNTPEQIKSSPGLPTAVEAEMMSQSEIASGLINLMTAIEDFCEEHKLKPVEKVIATLGTNFLCNAILNGKTIGEGYGKSKDHATYFAMYNAFVWMKQIFG